VPDTTAAVAMADIREAIHSNPDALGPVYRIVANHMRDLQLCDHDRAIQVAFAQRAIELGA
jgi:hypothetical protein